MAKDSSSDVRITTDGTRVTKRAPKKKSKKPDVRELSKDDGTAKDPIPSRSSGPFLDEDPLKRKLALERMEREADSPSVCGDFFDYPDEDPIAKISSAPPRLGPAPGGVYVHLTPEQMEELADMVVKKLKGED